MTPIELRDLERLLAKLDDCDLGEWDRDFIDDLCRRVMKFEERTTLTGKQWTQLQRIKEQYL